MNGLNFELEISLPGKFVTVKESKLIGNETTHTHKLKKIKKLEQIDTGY